MEEKMLSRGPGSTTGGLAYSLAVFVYLALYMIFSIVSSLCDFGSSSPAYVYVNYLVSPVAIAITSAVILKTRRVPFRLAVPLRTEPKYCVISVFLAFGLLFSLSWLNVAAERLLSLCGYDSSIGSYYLDLSGGYVVLALFAVALMPAVFEETLFRGIILNNTEREAGTLNTIFICGLCFALFHANPVQTIYQFVCGCVYALLAVRARSAVPGMIAHFLNNAVIIILGACGLDTNGTIFDMAPLWAAVLITALAALCFAASLVYLITENKIVSKPAPGGVKRFFIAAAAGIVALTLMWLSTLVYGFLG